MDKLVKDRDFPLQHLSISQFKDANNIAQQVQESDILLSDNGETVAYIVSPAHYQALVDRLQETSTATIVDAVPRRHPQVTEAVCSKREARLLLISQIRG